MQKEEYIWWEKSVEYKFICELLGRGQFNLFLPLDGHEEQLGDLMLISDANYLLIEFKRDIKSFQSEYAKYETQKNPSDGMEKFEAIKETLTSKENIQKYPHHFLVAGALKKGDTQSLELDIYNYFSLPNPVGKSLTIDDMLEGKVSKDIFDEYANLLSRAKLGVSDEDETESSSSGGKAKSLVIGVSPRKEVTIIELDLYLKLKLKKKSVPTLK